ncbi:Nn.00g032540.m01.CDS01 [Neocucurbitaria sp. VM-36]
MDPSPYRRIPTSGDSREGGQPSYSGSAIFNTAKLTPMDRASTPKLPRMLRHSRTLQMEIKVTSPDGSVRNFNTALHCSICLRPWAEHGYLDQRAAPAQKLLACTAACASCHTNHAQKMCPSLYITTSKLKALYPWPNFKHPPAHMFIRPTEDQQAILRAEGYLEPAAADGQLRWTPKACNLATQEWPILMTISCASHGYEYNTFVDWARRYKGQGHTRQRPHTFSQQRPYDPSLPQPYGLNQQWSHGPDQQQPYGQPYGAVQHPILSSARNPPYIEQYDNASRPSREGSSREVHVHISLDRELGNPRPAPVLQSSLWPATAVPQFTGPVHPSYGIPSVTPVPQYDTPAHHGDVLYPPTPMFYNTMPARVGSTSSPHNTRPTQAARSPPRSQARHYPPSGRAPASAVFNWNSTFAEAAEQPSERYMTRTDRPNHNQGLTRQAAPSQQPSLRYSEKKMSRDAVTKRPRPGQSTGNHTYQNMIDRMNTSRRGRGETYARANAGDPRNSQQYSDRDTRNNDPTNLEDDWNVYIKQENSEDD